MTPRLMMSVLSRPDRRDGMSLPPDNINWKALDKHQRKLRIGLMLDLDVGQALEQDVRDVAVKAAKAFESAGAAVTEVKGILTREMLDGLDNFWRARLWDDLSQLAPAERGKALPYILKWAEAGAKLSGLDVIRGFNATMAIRAAAGKLFADHRLRHLAGFAGGEIRSRTRRPHQRSRQSRSSISATPCPGTCRKIRRSRSTADMTPRAFRSACRSSAAASTTSACSAWPRRSRACAARNVRGRGHRK